MNKLLSLLLFLFLAVHHVSVVSGLCPCEKCISKRQLLERFQLIPQSLMHNVSELEDQPQACNPLPPSIITTTPKRVIDFTSPPFDVLINGDTVFVGEYLVGKVHKFDHEGNLLNIFNVPTGFAANMELRDGKLYVANHIDSIYIKSACTDDDFVVFLSLDFLSVDIRFTPNGSQLLIGEFLESKVHVFNTQSKLLVQTITIPSSDVRTIRFDTNGNMLVATNNADIHIYDENFNFLQTVTYPGAGQIDGWIFQCDGSKILADRTGGVIFVDEDDIVVEIRTLGFNIFYFTHVGITNNGTLFITDQAKKLFIY